MTFLTVKKHPVQRSFNNLMNDFLFPFSSMLKDDFGTASFKQFAPVNVKEKEDGYELEVAAPGMAKEDFKISLDKNLLTIEAEKKNEAENKEQKTIRKEYKYQSFKRLFTIDETIDTEKIDAKYINGILTLNLPKKVKVKEPAKEITIQ